MPTIYLDNHATTRVDPRVVDAMLPWFTEQYANPGSSTHEAGREVKRLVDESLESIGAFFGVGRDEVIITSGATESNNLALFGICQHPRQRRKQIVTAPTEHPTILEPVQRAARSGIESVYCPVYTHPDPRAGLLDLDALQDLVTDQTAMVSVMLANNEIGVVQDLPAVSTICRNVGAILHTDATQAICSLPVNLAALGVDLLSFSAHKIYGPKGIGGLVINPESNIRLTPQIVGGGQQNNWRSGTLNSPGIIGLAKALALVATHRETDGKNAWELRAHLWRRLSESIPGLALNGPNWERVETPVSPDTTFAELVKDSVRLAGNLNVCFPKVDGQSLMLEIPNLAVSSGSACTSSHPEPSHVLQAIGRTEDEARASIRFGIGRFNTRSDIDLASDWLVQAHRKLVSFVA